MPIKRDNGVSDEKGEKKMSYGRLIEKMEAREAHIHNALGGDYVLTAKDNKDLEASSEVIDRSYAYAKFADTQAAAATDAFIKRGWRMVARFSRAAGEEALNFDSADQAKIARFRAAVRRAVKIIKK